MALKLLFFAQCSDWIRQKEMEVPIKVRETGLEVVGRLPGLKPILEHRGILRVSVNREFAGFDEEVQDGDEVAFLPPVSGG